MSADLLQRIIPSVESIKSSLGMAAPTLPKSYKAAIFKKANEPLTIEEVPLKEPTQGQVLIKTIACGVCHSDIHIQDGDFGDLFPRVPGHEVVGRVAAVGPGEKEWKVGDLVGGPWHGGHDATCLYCKRGQFNLCKNEAINGVTMDGGYAEYCLLRSEAVVSIPAHADPVSYAPLLCAGVTLFNGIRNMGIIGGETVAIQGLGGLGHLGIQYANKLGFRVVALSSSAAKEKFAKDLGAHDYIDGSKEDHGQALQKLGGAALIVSTAPNPKIMGSLLNGLQRGGKLMLLAPAGDIPINTLPLITQNLSVCGWASGHSLDSEEAIKFAEVHGVKCMVEKFPLEKANEALQHMKEGKARFRCVLVFE